MKPISQKSLSRAAAVASPKGCTRPESLFGLWAIEPAKFQEYVRIAKTMDLRSLASKAKADGSPAEPIPTLDPEESDDGVCVGGDDYEIVEGIAMFSICGPMTKYQTSFQDVVGGTATVPLRRAIRAARYDPRVESAILRVDSPGGTVSGTGDLAADIAAFDSEKPMYGYAEDQACSAGIWVLSQCRKIFANPTATIGCIGTMMALSDTSKMYDKAGIQVHIVTSDAPGGDTMKGAGVDGTAITDEQLADFKRVANEINDHFVAGVASGRGMTPENVCALADGRVHIGEKAKALGLIDEISSFDDAMQAIYKDTKQMNAESFKAFAAANPDDPTVKALQAQGFKAGKSEAATEARTELGKMLATFTGREKFAAEQFVKGHDSATAKGDLADILAEENKALHAKIADQAKIVAKHADDNPAIKLAPAQAETKADADFGAMFEAAFEAELKRTPDRGQAMAKVVAANPQLHSDYIRAKNAKK